MENQQKGSRKMTFPEWYQTIAESQAMSNTIMFITLSVAATAFVILFFRGAR
jgi:hypothetical protein